MRYCFFFCCFYLCYACQQAETAPAMLPAPKAKVDRLSSFGQAMLAQQQEGQESLVKELYWKSLPKLPGDSTFFGQLQVNALETGSRKALHKHYKRIITPSKINAAETTKFLDLGEQNIHFIPNKVTQYPNLRYLSLKNNQIQAINPKLSHCKKLVKLDLSSNGLHKIPFGLIYLNQIQELNLADNKLSSLPSYFYNLHNLKIIDISNVHTAMAVYYNNITAVPNVLLRMPNVQKLFLEKLPLSSLPSNLYQMTDLHVLSLNGNREMNLYKAFEVLAKQPNLIALDISFIGRRTIPQNIAKLKKLKILVWHEENHINKVFVLETLRKLLPNTKIYFGESGVATPFLRGNSISTLKNVGQ